MLSGQPEVQLGTLIEGGLAPAIMAIVERGVWRRPELAGDLRAEIELEMGDAYPPVRILFGEGMVLVEDGPGTGPDLRVKATLPDLVALMAAPLVGGLPSPIDRRGRSALGMVVGRRVRIEGRLGLMRRLLAVICV